MADDTDRVLLGEIGAAQGLKGEVRLRSYTQAPAAIARYGPLDDETGRQIEIEHLRVTPKALIARIKGVTTREGAEALNRTKLYLPRAALPGREEGSGTSPIWSGSRRWMRKARPRHRDRGP